jgi:hypothetical protein
MGPTVIKGNRSLYAVVAALLARGVHVYLPAGDGYRRDMLVEMPDGTIGSMQAKTGKISKGAINFASCSTTPTGRLRKSYRGEVDYFAVYCVETDQVYVLPVSDAPETVAKLRVAPSLNNQAKLIRWAKDFEIDTIFGAPIPD